MTHLTLVLLPGLDGTGDLFKPFMAAMGPGFKCVAVRYPAFGPQGYKELEAFVRDSLPVTEPFVLLGESFSGPIAISIAAAPPANLLATVLCATFASNPQPMLASLGWLLPFASPRLAPMAVASALLMGSQRTPALQAALRESLAGLAPAVFRARLKAVLHVDVLAKLAVVPGPVLYLQALQDRLVPLAATAAVLQANSKVQIAPINGPHFLLQVCPAQAAAHVCSFMAAANNDAA